MNGKWTEADILKYIADTVQENLNLDYKAAASLARTDEKRREITKDVSAMANSDGGVVIYGILEDKTVTPHVPSKVDPVDASIISKEWLEQVINTIRPRLDGVIIHPVQLSSATNHFVYVVEIPQSTTAHQAQDKRYYKRFNFESTAMEDYEIRDVMGRMQHPKIELEFEIEIKRIYLRGYPSFDAFGREEKPQVSTLYNLYIWAINTGNVYAQYVNASIEIPDILLPEQPENGPPHRKRETFEKQGIRYYEHYEDNTVRDVVDTGGSGMWTYNKYGPARYVPLLPNRSQGWQELELNDQFESIDVHGLVIEWVTYADNAPPNRGSILVKDIEIIDRRDEPPEG